MKKTLILIMVLTIFFLTSCNRLSELKSDMTPEKWLNSHPHFNVSIGSLKFIFAEPSSSFFVFSLGIILLIIGILILKKYKGEKTVLFWSLAFIVWAISTFSAGVSYQAFSYEIKCAGRSVCLWTSWWEIIYLFLFVMAVNLIIIAVSFSSSKGKFRKLIIGYALSNFIVYSTLLFKGAFLPDKFLVSFEFMVLFSGPTFVILLITNLISYKIRKEKLDLLLVFEWLFMFFIVILYFCFYISKIPEILWAKGIWFNANDLLHITLILWVLFFYFKVSRYLKDLKN